MRLSKSVTLEWLRWVRLIQVTRLDVLGYWNCILLMFIQQELGYKSRIVNDTFFDINCSCDSSYCSFISVTFSNFIFGVGSVIYGTVGMASFFNMQISFIMLYGHIFWDWTAHKRLYDNPLSQELGQFECSDQCSTSQGTPPFQPPEIALRHSSWSGFKADIWAAGVTL